MSDEHLWDGSGPADPELLRLEEGLRPLRYRGALPLDLGPQDALPVGRPLLPRLLAAAAVVLVGVGLVLQPRAGEARGWECRPLTGRPRLAGASLERSARLRVGEWLETDDDSRARLQIADIGELTLEGRSRLRLVETGPSRHRLELARGRFHALVSAPPRLFVVDTPAATAVDLGCEYTLEVDDEGSGLLAVSLGFVALERDGRSSVVRAGARCKLRGGRGPGTPYRADARAEFLGALDALDFDDAGYETLCKLLSNARGADVLTLWHLLPRFEGEGRAAIYDRMVGLSEAPAGVTREGTLRLDPVMLEAWRAYLGFAG